jgi:hypothetical protein
MVSNLHEISSSWVKETQFLNMDNYLIKYNKWLFYKIMQVWFALQSTNVFYSLYCDCTLKAIEGFSRLCKLFQEAT